MMGQQQDSRRAMLFSIELKEGCYLFPDYLRV
jgi:hypothetical protein